jgi:hypothetical protein
LCSTHTNVGTERSTVAREEKHPIGKLPRTMVSKPRRPLGILPLELCVCTQFRSKPSSCNELLVSSFFLSCASDTSFKCLYIRCYEEYTENSGRLVTKFVFYVIMYFIDYQGLKVLLLAYGYPRAPDVTVLLL